MTESYDGLSQAKGSASVCQWALHLRQKSLQCVGGCFAELGGASGVVEPWATVYGGRVALRY
jgi:hypothetical protein